MKNGGILRSVQVCLVQTNLPMFMDDGNVVARPSQERPALLMRR